MLIYTNRYFLLGKLMAETSHAFVSKVLIYGKQLNIRSYFNAGYWAKIIGLYPVIVG